MSKRRDQDYLEDILEAMERIGIYIDNLTYEQFLRDIKTQDAVIRNLEVIGEGTKHLSPVFRKANPQVPWKDMAGARDRLIHNYFGINYEIIWQIAKEELPELRPLLEGMKP